jgi:predicted ester cyclase
MAEQANAVIRRFFDEALNQGRLEVLDELIAADGVFDTPFGRFEGPEGVRNLVGGFRAAFSDLHAEIDEIIGEGRRFVARVTVSGTNDGELMGAAPTGKRAVWSVAHFNEIKDGKYQHDQVFVDRMGLMEQLGLVPQPA